MIAYTGTHWSNMLLLIYTINNNWWIEIHVNDINNVMNDITINYLLFFLAQCEVCREME